MCARSLFNEMKIVQALEEDVASKVVEKLLIY